MYARHPTGFATEETSLALIVRVEALSWHYTLLVCKGPRIYIAYSSGRSRLPNSGKYDSCGPRSHEYWHEKRNVETFGRQSVSVLKSPTRQRAWIRMREEVSPNQSRSDRVSAGQSVRPALIPNILTNVGEARNIRNLSNHAMVSRNCLTGAVSPIVPLQTGESSSCAVVQRICQSSDALSSTTAHTRQNTASPYARAAMSAQVSSGGGGSRRPRARRGTLGMPSSARSAASAAMSARDALAALHVGSARASPTQIQETVDALARLSVALRRGADALAALARAEVRAGRARFATERAVADVEKGIIGAKMERVSALEETDTIRLHLARARKELEGLPDPGGAFAVKVESGDGNSGSASTGGGFSPLKSPLENAVSAVMTEKEQEELWLREVEVRVEKLRHQSIRDLTKLKHVNGELEKVTDDLDSYSNKRKILQKRLSASYDEL
jgi:hypothetical protein